MDPILESKLLGVGTPYSGTNMERNELIGLIRRMIKENKYTVDYILNYCQSLGYQYIMASDIFQELTGMNPKVLVNNDEYYQNPVFVPSMTLAWGYKKSTKNEAFYVVPFEYGYSVMFKNEKDAPESQFQFITIDEAVNKLKSLVTKVFTINKIITDNCLENDDIQLNANTVHNVNNPYFSSPINEMKQAFINKVIDQSQFEKKAFRLVAEEKITTKEAEDAMKWLDDLQKERDIEDFENVEFGNIKNDDKMKIQEENKQLEGSTLEFDDVVDEIYTTIGDEYADKNKLRRLFYKNKSFFKGLNKEQAAQKLYELYLGFSKDEISGKDKYVKKNKITSSNDDYDKFEEEFENDFIIDDENGVAWFPGYENYKITIENDYDKMKEKAFKIWKKINSSLKKKARNWLVKMNLTKEMNDLEKWVDENGEFDAEQDTPVEFEELVGKFCDKLFTYKDEIAEKIGDDAASEFDDIVTELKYDGPCSTDQFNYMLNDLYDFCDNVSIWLETHGRIEASLKKKAADEDIELDDIKEKDVMKDTIDEINDTDFNELVKEETPQEYLEEESKNEQVNKVNEKVSKIIDEFTSKFDDFTKYKLQMSTYKLQILNQGSDDTSLQPIEDTELNAQAILQIILTIAPVEDLENSKKALAIFSINKDKVLFNGTLRMEDGFVAFSEEGLSAIFENEDKENEITDDLI